MERDELERLAVIGHFQGGRQYFAGPISPAGRGRARRGDVRLALLLLLAENERNGYQLMQAIEERSAGRWRPSPGAVYPALAHLEDEGYVRAIERDGTKLFALTAAGRRHLAERHETSAPWECEGDPDVDLFEAIRKLAGQVGVAATQVAQAGDRRQLKRAAAVLNDTRRSLYRILAEEDDDG